MYKRYLTKLSRTRLDDVLIDEGALERSHIDDAQAESEMTGRPLAHVLFEREEIDEWELAKIVARNYSLPFVDVVTYSTPREAEVLLDLEFCNTHLLVPFDLFGDLPAVAACEMPSEAVIEEIERRCGQTPFVYVTLRSRLMEELATRAEAGNAPATAADLPPPRVGAGATGGGVHVAANAADLDLEPASMRLGFNMHMRGRAKGSGGRVSAPPPPPRPIESSRPARKPRPAPLRSTPEPAAVAPPSPEPLRPVEAPLEIADEGAPGPDAAKEGAGKAAAWQSIFDLGDDAVDA